MTDNVKTTCLTFVSRSLVTNVCCASLFNSCNLKFPFYFQNPLTYGQYQAHRPDHYAGAVDSKYNRSYMQVLDLSSAYASSPHYGGTMKGPYHEQHNHADFEDGIWVRVTILYICKITMNSMGFRWFSS